MTDKYSAPMSFKAKAGPTIKWGLGITTALVGTTVGLGVGLSLLAGNKAGQKTAAVADEALLPDITALNDIGWFVSNSLGLSVALVAGGATILLAVQSWILSQNQMRLAAQDFLSEDLKRMRETANVSQDLMFKFAKSTLAYAEKVRDYVCFTSLGVYAGSGGDLVDRDSVRSAADLPKIVSTHTMASEREAAVNAIMKLISSYNADYDDGSEALDIKEELTRRFNYIYSGDKQIDLKKSLESFIAETVGRELEKQFEAVASDGGRKLAQEVKNARSLWLESIYVIVSHLTNPQADPISRAIWEHNLRQKSAVELISRIERHIDSMCNLDDVEYDWMAEELAQQGAQVDAKLEYPTISIFRRIETALQGPAIVNIDTVEEQSDWFIGHDPSRYFRESTKRVYKYLPRLGVYGDPRWNSRDSRASLYDPEIYLYTNKGSDLYLDERAAAKRTSPTPAPTPDAKDAVKKPFFRKFSGNHNDEYHHNDEDYYAERGRKLLEAVRSGDEHDLLGDVSELLRFTTSKRHAAEAIREYLQGSVSKDLIEEIVLANEKYIPKDIFDDLANKPAAPVKKAVPKTPSRPAPPRPPIIPRLS